VKIAVKPAPDAVQAPAVAETQTADQSGVTTQVDSLNAPAAVDPAAASASTTTSTVADSSSAATQSDASPFDDLKADASAVNSQTSETALASVENNPILKIAGALGGQSSGGWALYANLGLTLLMLLVGLFVAVRSFNAIFAFQFLMAHPDISPKEAMQKSIEAIKGNWWKVSLYNLFFIITAALPFGAIIFVMINVIKGPVWLTLTPILTLLIVGIIISFNSVFQQFLAQELYNKKRYSISLLMKVLTALIIILPILGVAGVMFLLPMILKNGFGG
jgi:hypothetical protein